MPPRIYKISIRPLGCGSDLCSYRGISRVRKSPFTAELADSPLDDLYGKITFRARVAFPLSVRVMAHELLLLVVEGGSNCMHVRAVHCALLHEAVDGMNGAHGAPLLPFSQYAVAAP